MTTRPARPTSLLRATATSATAAPALSSHGPEEPEWGRSTLLLAHELENLMTFEDVFPLWNNRDVPALLEHYTEDIVWHNVAMGRPTTAGRRWVPS